MRIASSLIMTAVLAACAVDDTADDDNLPDGPATAESAEGKADTAEGERKVRAGQLTLTLNSTTSLVDENGERVLIVRASTSRRVEYVFSYVPDDAFGEARLIDPTHFELVLRAGHELNSILSGLPLLVQIRTETGTIRDYNARISLAPRLARFTGSSKVYLDAAVDPIYLVDPLNPLHYRATLTTTANASSFSTTVAGAEVVADGPRAAHVDFTYDQLATVLGGQLGVTARFANGTTGTKRAGVDVRVVRVGLTTEDPYDTWPSPTCTDETLACLVDLDDPGRDWSSCGSYRETQVCAFEHMCEIVAPEPFTLERMNDTSIQYAREAFDAACPSGGSWCHLDTLEAYALPRCQVAPFAEVVDAVLATVQDPPFEGAVAPPEQSIFLNDSYSPEGPQLFNSLRGWVGGWESPVEAWIGVEEVPCHNCTDFVDRTILYFPERERVIVLTGGHGYDS
jgi:hypothetical protein